MKIIHTAKNYNLKILYTLINKPNSSRKEFHHRNFKAAVFIEKNESTQSQPK